MQQRLLKICTLFISLALMVLPVQQAFANSVMAASMQADTDNPAHCFSTGNSADKVVSGTKVAANDCCCEQCDSHCPSDCSSHAASVMIFDMPAHAHQLSLSVFQPLEFFFASQGYAPPSPPPLS